MKKSVRKPLACLLTGAMLLSNFAFANVNGTLPTAGVSPQDFATSYLGSSDMFNDEVNAMVRVIVEMNQKPVLQLANERNVALESLAGEAKSLDATQDRIIDKAEKEIKEAVVHQQFTTSINGFSMTLPESEVDTLMAIDGVARVTRVNTYERPEIIKDMNNSHNLTKSNFVNDEMGYKGEGLVVAIIDSGIDVKHQDMKLDEGVNVHINAENLKAIKDKAALNPANAGKLKGHFFTDKVPYGWNYMDDSDFLKDTGVDNEPHGMHVAGTVAANGELKGVAPNAQLLALKVFGNDPLYPSTYGDIIIAAIDDAILLGADVMNLSLGSSAAFVEPNDPEQVAVRRAVEAGIVMSISAGNSGFMGSPAGNPLATNPDIGVVGSPGLSTESLMVASVDNYAELNAFSINAIGQKAPIMGYASGTWESKAYEVVPVGGTLTGVKADFAGKDFNGKVALVRRGNLFVDTCDNAKAAGAVGVMLQNLSTRPMNYTPAPFSVPFMMLDSTAEQLFPLAEGGSLTVNINAVPGLVNPTTGRISSFSSWGTTPSLDFKPEISAPGGNILSTFNVNENGVSTYGFLSGTSMASPHVAGGTALLLQRLNQGAFKSVYGEDVEKKARIAKAILMNTARPIQDSNDDFQIPDSEIGHNVAYTSPRSQGAGSMDLKSALTTDVFVVAKNTLDAKYNAGVIANDGFSFILTAYNTGKEDITFGVGANLQTNDESGGRNLLRSVPLAGAKINVTVGDKTARAITVPANGQIDFTVTVDVKDAKLSSTGKAFLEAFPNGNFIEGFVKLYPQNAETNKAIEVARVAYVDAQKAVDDNAALIVKVNADIVKAKADIAAKEKVSKDTQKVYDDMVAENAKMIDTYKAYEAARVAFIAAEAANNAFVSANGTLQAIETKIAAAEAFLDAFAKMTSANFEADTLQGQFDAAKAAQLACDAQLTKLKEDRTALIHANPADPKIQELTNEIQKLEIELGKLTVAANALEPKLKEAMEVLKLAKAALELSKQALEAAGITNTVDLSAQVTTLKDLLVQGKALALTLKTTDATFKSETAKVDNIPAWEVLRGKLEAALKVAQEALAALNAAKEVLVKLEKDLETAVDQTDLLLEDRNTKLNAYYDAEMNYRQAMPLNVPFISFKGDWSKAPAIDAIRGGDTGASAFVSSIGDKLYNLGKTGVFSPNGDKKMDSIYPNLFIKRNIKDLIFEIYSMPKTDVEVPQLLKVLGTRESERKDFAFFTDPKNTSAFPQFTWDGTIENTVAADDGYLYVVRSKIDGGDEQALIYPVFVDNTAPVFSKFNLLVKEVEDKNNVKTRIVDVQVTFKDGIAVKEYILYKKEAGQDVEVERNAKGIFNLTKYPLGTKFVFGAEDFACNIGKYTAKEFVKEAKEPFVQIDSPSKKYVYYTNKLTVEGFIIDPAVTYVTIDGKVVELTPDPKVANRSNFTLEIDHVKDGKNWLNVYAVDMFGNEQPYRVFYFADQAAPTLEVSAKSAGKPVEFKEGVAILDSATKYVDLNIKAGDNYPVIDLFLNGSLIHHQEKDYYAYDANFVPAKFEATFKYGLKPGANVIQALVQDDANRSTTVGYTIYVGQPEKALNLAKPNGVTGPTVNSGNATQGLKDIHTTNLPKYVEPTTPENPNNNNNNNNSNTNPNTNTNTNPNTNTNNNTTADNTVVINDPVTPLGAVKFLKAYINGYADGTFKAENTVTRGEFAKMLAVILELDVTGTTTSYSDVTTGWTVPYVKAVSDAKVLTGYANGKFEPNQAITRAEIAQALSNVWTYKKVAVKAATTNLKDVATHANYEAIAKLNANGVIAGYPDQTFKPNNTATRAEAVKMINVFMAREVKAVVLSKFADVAGHWALGHIESASTDIQVLQTK